MKWGKHSAEECITASWCAGRLTSTALLENVLHSPVQLPRRLTSRLVSAVPWGMGVVKKHPSLYEHLSRAGSDPPKSSVPGIVPFPRYCQGIQLGAVCSCSSGAAYTQVLRRDWTLLLDLLTCYESCSKITLQRSAAAKSVVTVSATLQQKLNCK